MSSENYNNLLSDGNAQNKIELGSLIKKKLLKIYTNILFQNETLQGLIELEIEHLDKN
jgi:hypothetical protein